MEGKYQRIQKARLLSMSTPFDTCVIECGSKVDIHTSIKSRQIGRLAEKLEREGKTVRIHHDGYYPKRDDGWEVEQ